MSYFLFGNSDHVIYAQIFQISVRGNGSNSIVSILTI